MPRNTSRRSALLLQLIGWPLLLLILLARLRRAPRSSILELLDIWAPHLLLTSWPLGLVALRWRSASLGLLTLIGGLAGLATSRSALGRARPARPSSGPRVRIITANVLALNPSAKALAELIASEQPDVVACQEVRSDYGADLVRRVGTLLPYWDIMHHRRFAGAALFSRWPLTELEHFRLSERGHLCQRARLLIDGRPLHVFNIHLETPFEVQPTEGGLLPFTIWSRAASARDREIDTLIDLVERIEEPCLVVGDFNAAAGSRPHRQLRRHFRDAFQELGRGLGHTFPQAISIYGAFSPAPLLRIDYAFFKGALDALAVRTLNNPGSDHRALLADFAVGHAPAGASRRSKERTSAAVR